jgi:Divergent InlB B-repeat domain
MSRPLCLRATVVALAAITAATALALPSAASAAESFTFAVTLGGQGEGEGGEVECEFVEPVEGEPEPEEYEEPCPETPTSYPKNTKVEIIPEAEEPEFEFVDFENGTGNASKCTAKTTCKVTLTENTMVEARFDYVTFALKVKTAGDGMGAVECEVIYAPTSEYPSEAECEAEAGHPSEVRYPYGTELVLYAKGEESNFLGWEGCEYEEEEECEVTMEGPRSVTASFESTAERTLTLDVTGPGTVSGSPGSIHCPPDCSGRFRVGTAVTLTATPAPGAVFDGWTGGGCKGLAPCTVTVGGDTSVFAEFESLAQLARAEQEEEAEESRGGKAGRAKAAHVARVKAGRAALKLRCQGGPCRGRLRLVARVGRGRKARHLIIGKASFRLAAGASKTIAVGLSGPAKRELAGGGALAAKLSGSGVVARAVKLVPQKPHKRH